MLDRIRRAGAVAMGMAATPDLAARAVPKMAIVGTPTTPGAQIGIQMLSMGTPHPAVPITGSVALTMAATTDGSVVAQRAGDADASGLRLDTPAGIVETFSQTDDGSLVVGVIRTYRRLAEGVAYLPAPHHTPSPTATLAEEGPHV